ncbi:hypothetical protein KIPB_007475 [Kipferlia bialata]|uniref:Uncharacterized protein n=1 Tax=Kipferlia bialata TaxID=797122 RepID=A0A9K3GK26_9EUKA|nr:hypothetical protein KIPB_007475 [Kipferlia bialata]|eukprot:g7475.t1
MQRGSPRFQSQYGSRQFGSRLAGGGGTPQASTRANADMYAFQAQQLGIQPRDDFVSALSVERGRQIVGGSDVGPKDVTALCRALTGAKMISLVKLSHNAIGDEGSFALAEAMMNNAPVRRLVLSDNKIGPTGITNLATALKGNTNVTEVVIEDNVVGDDGAFALASTLEANSTIRSLVLRRTGITDAGAASLAQSLGRSHLAHLCLEENDIGPDGATAVSRALSSAGCPLEHVSMAGNPLTNDGVFALAPYMPRVPEVLLGQCCVGPHGADALAQSFLANPSNGVTTLDLSGNRIAGVGAISLARVLHCLPSLERLILRDNKIGNRGCFALSHAVAMHASLQEVHLDSNLIGDSGAQAMTKCFEASASLSVISLQYNYVTGEGELALGETLSGMAVAGQLDISNQLERDTGVNGEGLTLDQECDFFDTRDDLCVKTAEVWSRYVDKCQRSGSPPNSQLLRTFTELRGESESGDRLPTSLSLSGQNLGSFGVWAISEILSLNGTITSLDLSHNRISTEGAASLAAIVANRNSVLTHLDISDNSIQADGACLVAEALETSSLTQLSMAGNDIGDRGCAALSRVLRDNTSLTSLDISRNSISYDGALALTHALRTNGTLAHLSLADNLIRDEGAQALMDPIRDYARGLVTLSLARCSLRGCAHYITAALAVNTSLETLVLDGNQLTDSGTSVLARGLASMGGLKVLSLRRNGVDPVGASEVRAAVRNHPSLNCVLLEESSLPSETVTSSVAPPLSHAVVPFGMADCRVAMGRAATQGKGLAESQFGRPTGMLSPSALSMSGSQRGAMGMDQRGSMSPAQLHNISIPKDEGEGEREGEAREGESVEGDRPPLNNTLNTDAQQEAADASHDTRLPELASELAAVQRHIFSLEKRRDHLIVLCRAAQEREHESHFNSLKVKAVATIRTSLDDGQVLPPLKPLSTEEKMVETNLARSFAARLETSEKELDALVANVEALGRQSTAVEGNIAASVMELSDAEAQLRAIMGSGNSDMLGRAEQLNSKKQFVEKQIMKEAAQKEIVLKQRRDGMLSVLQTLRLVNDLKEERKGHLDALVTHTGDDPTRPARYQTAVGALQRVLDLRSLAEQHATEEADAIGRWEATKMNLDEARRRLRDAEQAEEACYVEVQRFHQATLDSWKAEELFRAKISLTALSTPEVTALIPVAQSRYQHYAPLMIERNELSRSLDASVTLLAGYEGELEKLDRVAGVRSDSVATLQSFLRVQEQLVRKQDFLRQWLAKISALQQALRIAREDRDRAMGSGDYEAFKQTEAQVQRLDATIGSLSENRDVLAQEVDSLHDQAEEEVQRLRDMPSATFMELLLILKVPQQARSSALKAIQRKPARGGRETNRQRGMQQMQSRVEADRDRSRRQSDV